jgi:hypothetical protein
MIVYDSKKFIFININENEKKHYHKVINKSELLKIAKTNLINTRQFIKDNGLNNTFLHFSMTKIEKLKFEKNTTSWNADSKSVYFNPNGLWISHGSSWLDFVEKNNNGPGMWNLFSYTYKIIISDSIKIISNIDQFYDFIEEFKNSNKIIKLYDVINWEKVKKKYDGLIISPWLGDEIWEIAKDDKFTIWGGESAHNFFVQLLGSKWKDNKLLLSEWYRHWETSTGVIWNSAGVRDIELIKFHEFKDI